MNKSWKVFVKSVGISSKNLWKLQRIRIFKKKLRPFEKTRKIWENMEKLWKNFRLTRNNFTDILEKLLNIEKIVEKCLKKILESENFEKPIDL